MSSYCSDEPKGWSGQNNDNNKSWYRFSKTWKESFPIYVDFKNWHETTVFNDEEMLNKIEDKANKCGCKCVIIANIVTEKEWKIHRIERNGLTIVEIPSLLTGDKSPNLNNEAWNEIRRCINEYSN